MTQVTTAVIGVIFLVLGLLGVLPPTHEPYPGDVPRLEVRNAIGMIFGVIPSNLPSALLHLVSGVLGLAVARRGIHARTYLQAVAVVFGVLAILGAMPPTSTLFATIPLFGFNMWLHAVVAVVALWTGWPVPPDSDEEWPATGEARNALRGLTSRATIAGRPLHPMLTPYPIAFVTGALVTDLAYWWTTLPWYNGYVTFWPRASLWLLAAGVTCGLLAAFVGAIDHFRIPRVRMLRAARLHALSGIAVVVLAAVNLGLRLGDAASHTLPWGITLSLSTVLLLGATVWHGNVLVYRNRVGVRGYGLREQGTGNGEQW